MGGLRHLTAHPSGSTDLPPPRCGISISDDLAGLYAAIGLLAALWQRDARAEPAPGAGRVIDVNLVDSVFSLMEGMLPEYALDGRVRQPVGAAIATAAPTNTYPCADGKWLCIAGNSDLIFRRLMTAIGRPELGADPRLRHQRRPLRPARRTGCGDRAPGRGGTPAREAEAVLEAAEVPCSRLYDIADCAHGSAFPGAEVGAAGRRSADRPDAASRSGDPPGRRRAGGGGGLARPGGGRAHGVRACTRCWGCRE